MSEPARHRVIGIDPGTHIAGYGIVDLDGPKRTLVECGIVEAKKSLAGSERLKVIFESFEKIIQQHKPTAACVEDVFAGKNVRTAMKIGEGRGVALLALARGGLEVHGLPPAEIKKSITGNGRADKAQVQRMVAHLLALDEPPEPYDATDALAAALCLCNRL